MFGCLSFSVKKDLVDSTSEGRRMIKQGAVKVNGDKYETAKDI